MNFSTEGMASGKGYVKNRESTVNPNGLMPSTEIEKVPTHIPGLDWICKGGLPKNTTSLLGGGAGCGKTVLGLQFLTYGAMYSGEPGVFITFEEVPPQLRRYMRGFGWDGDGLEDNDMLRFIDLSPDPSEPPPSYSGEFDFGGLVTRIEAAVRSIGAKRLCLDSLAAMLKNFGDERFVRFELFRLISAMRTLEITTLITDEVQSESSFLATGESYNIEDFVVDNLIVLRNRLDLEQRRRTIEVLKFRGTDHQKGEFPFTIADREGIVIIPLSEMELKQESSSERVTSGIAELDELCGGGMFDGSVVLVTGATGCGKTLMTTQFISGGQKAGRRSLLLGFEESRSQLLRNASSWGVDFASGEEGELLRISCIYPEAEGLEDHLIRIKRHVEAFKPDRVVIDSLSALERVSTKRAFREFVVALTSFLKDSQVTSLMTLTTPTLMGGSSVTEGHISSIADSIILLRYVETLGEVRRAITVLKMRGSWHDKEIREFVIDGAGMHIGGAFKNMTGILSGDPRYRAENDTENRVADYL